jgi:hypothetical protein
MADGHGGSDFPLQARGTAQRGLAAFGSTLCRDLRLYGNRWKACTMGAMTAERDHPASHHRGGAGMDASARRGRYVSAVLGSAVIFWLVNIWPGWQTVPFLSPATSGVLGIFNASLVISVIVNLVNIAANNPWVRALGEIITSAIGLVVLARLWTIVPFDFGSSSFNWILVARILIVLACAGCGISIVVQLVTISRLALGSPPRRHQGQSPHRAGHYRGSTPE